MKQVHVARFAAKLLEVKSPQQADEASNGTKGTITAQVTSFGPRETIDGRKFFYQKEGFAQWADEFNAGDRPLPMYVNHQDLALPAGEWYQVEMDDAGMMMSGNLFLNTQLGKDTYSILKESPRLMGGVSIGAYADESRFVTKEGEPTDDLENGYFQITKGGAKEVSIVMNPANPEAKIQTLEKFLGSEINPRYIERALREKGMKCSDAVMASSLIKELFIGLRDEAAVLVTAQKAKESSDLLRANEAALLQALSERRMVERLQRTYLRK